ncbi:MAG: hypothetical protein DRJ10_08880 [Bacteroidetes bacterium]|nr:MAG: hypothetical protein DRJ10_08880 [Bacteroidota bacterium]
MKPSLKFSLSFLLFFVLIIVSCGPGGFSAKIDKNTYAPGETIVVEYTADPNWDESAWIGIIPSDVMHGKEIENEDYDIDYHHIEKSEKGIMKFIAPDEPGKYDIRMHDTDDGATGVEISFVTFTVK